MHGLDSLVVDLTRAEAGLAFRGAAALGRVLAVAHLHAGEAQPRAVLAQHGHEVGVAIALACVVVSRRSAPPRGRAT